MKYTIKNFFKVTPRISQVFGVNPDYYKKFGFAGHEGIDYATPVGTEVFAPFDGVILRDTDDAKEDAYGKKVVIWSPSKKIAFWFCHLDSNNVDNGQKVSEGQLIGKTGNTGNSTGPHCHVNFCETNETGTRLNTTNGYKGFLDFTKLCEVKNYTDVPPPTQTPSSVDLGGFTTVLETYGIISIETLKSKLKAKDEYIKNHPEIYEPVFEPQITPEPPQTPDVVPVTPVPPQENSFDVLFSALLTWFKGLFGIKSVK